MKGLFQGMALTFKWLFERAETVQYPLEKYGVSSRYRGLIKQLGYVDLESAPLPLDELETPPCQGECPASVDVRGQNKLVSEGKFVEAYRLVQKSNILPGALGRICHHPCEEGCQRGYYDEPIAIRPLHRVISDVYAKASKREKKKPSLRIARKEKIAIIGAGPSGLAAAFDLANWGYKVTIFEKQDGPGGMLRIGVPKYRLPKDILRRDITDLAEFGFEIKTGVEIGKDIGLDDLKDQGYDAILLSVGLQMSNTLPIEGTDLDRVLLAIPFLEAANLDKKIDMGKEIVVIGGGNVAIDVARCALRKGAKKVRLACLESWEEMPAFSWEIEEAVEEGVEINNSWGPRRILSKAKKVTGVEFMECTRVFDEQGRFSPTYNEKNLTTLRGDTVIISIGQRSDLSFLEGTGVRLDERKRLIIDRLTLATTEPGVFACGEVTTGPATAVASIASGHDAAYSIHCYLQGKPVKKEDFPSSFPECEYQVPYFDVGVRAGEEERKRIKMPMAEPRKRVRDFRPVELGFTVGQGKVEALRCLQCLNKRCVGCGFCARICPNLVIEVERSHTKRKPISIDKYQANIAKCLFCGLCTEVCPTKSLIHTDIHELAVHDRKELIYDKKGMLKEKVLKR